MSIFSLETHSLERVRMCDVSRETCAWGRRVLSCDNSWIFAAVHTETTTELAAGVIASCSHLTYAPLPPSNRRNQDSSTQPERVPFLFAGFGQMLRKLKFS